MIIETLVQTILINDESDTSGVWRWKAEIYRDESEGTFDIHLWSTDCLKEPWIYVLNDTGYQTQEDAVEGAMKNVKERS